MNSTEGWDDGNLIDGDGCSSLCTVELGWSWSHTVMVDTSVWTEVWMDGNKTASEEWDDGNNDNLDGWRNNWTIELGYSWMDFPPSFTSFCFPGWGNGARVGFEDWDDNNLQDNDGWSKTCKVEEGWEWKGGDSASKDQWKDLWGDGKIMQKQVSKWDDNNTIGGDGCSSDCVIEPEFIWMGGKDYETERRIWMSFWF